MPTANRSAAADAGWIVLKFGGTSVSRRERWDTIGAIAGRRAREEGARVLVVEDADSPTPHPLVHAIAVGLPPEDGSLAEAAFPSADNAGSGLHVGAGHRQDQKVAPRQRPQPDRRADGAWPGAAALGGPVAAAVGATLAAPPPTRGPDSPVPYGAGGPPSAVASRALSSGSMKASSGRA